MILPQHVPSLWRPGFFRVPLSRALLLPLTHLQTMTFPAAQCPFCLGLPRRDGAVALGFLVKREVRDFMGRVQWGRDADRQGWEEWVY